MDAALPATFHLTSDEVAYVEACLARRRELMTLAQAAPDGQVLARCEEATVVLAQQIGHDLLEGAVGRRVAQAEKKKSVRPGPANAAPGGTMAVRTPGR
jgi:hypothetical protein